MVCQACIDRCLRADFSAKAYPKVTLIPTLPGHSRRAFLVNHTFPAGQECKIMALLLNAGAPRSPTDRAVKGLVRPAARDERGHGPFTVRRRPQPPGAPAPGNQGAERPQDTGRGCLPARTGCGAAPHGCVVQKEKRGLQLVGCPSGGQRAIGPFAGGDCPPQGAERYRAFVIGKTTGRTLQV